MVATDVASRGIGMIESTPPIPCPPFAMSVHVLLTLRPTCRAICA